MSNDAAAALLSGNRAAIRRALAETEAGGGRAVAVKIAFARTYSIEAQLDALRLGFAAYGMHANLHVADIENLEAELLNPSSATLAFAPDAVVVLWRLQELHREFWERCDGWSAEQRRDAIESVILRLRGLVDGYGQGTATPLFLATLEAPGALGPQDATLACGRGWALARLNAEILELAAAHRFVYVFDAAAWHAREGAVAYDERLDLYARQPISRRSIGSFALALGRTLAPLFRAPAKVLALDLDNVLWGGIVGEDGVAGIAIGHDYPGNVYRRIQLFASALRARGIVLAVVSKNDIETVRQAFDERPEMILKIDDFAAVRSNWRPKPENLVEIARELNLGLDSVVFVDDQGFEREAMRFQLPEVRVLECGSDPLGILSALETTDAFDMLRVDEADRLRAADYTAQAERRRFASAGGTDMEGFFRSLETVVEIAPVQRGTLERAAQMLHKTNQFNLTTKRHSQAEVERIAGGEGAAITLSLRDRFGDQGIVGLALARAGGETGEVDSFLMSCRALGRGAEIALWACLVRRLERRGVRHLRATYARTAKNGQVADFFERVGMTLVREDGETKVYEAQLPLQTDVPEWLSVVELEPAQTALSGERR